MSTSAKNLLRFLGASAALLVGAAALTFIVDPLQLFRPARLFAAVYSSDTRMQNAGLIRSQDFDTVFMGTSLAIHYRQSDIDHALRARSLKLAMTGSNSHEQSRLTFTGEMPEVSRATCSAARWRGSRPGSWRDPCRR